MIIVQLVNSILICYAEFMNSTCASFASEFASYFIRHAAKREWVH